MAFVFQVPVRSVGAHRRQRRMVVVSMAPGGKDYDRKQRLREEVEAPFRKVRMAFYLASGASAAIGGFIASARVLAAFSGVSGVQPLGETVRNVAIDAAVVLAAFLLYRRDAEAGERRLQRIARGSRIARLKFQEDDAQVAKLADLRGSTGKRVVMIAGEFGQLQPILEAGAQYGERLADRDVVVAPVATDRPADFDALTGEWEKSALIKPVGFGDWKEWIDSEIAMSSTKPEGPAVLTVILRKDGKVGARSLKGIPWERMVMDFERIPKVDRYGMP